MARSVINVARACSYHQRRSLRSTVTAAQSLETSATCDRGYGQIDKPPWGNAECKFDQGLAPTGTSRRGQFDGSAAVFEMYSRRSMGVPAFRAASSKEFSWDISPQTKGRRIRSSPEWHISPTWWRNLKKGRLGDRTLLDLRVLRLSLHKKR